MLKDVTKFEYLNDVSINVYGIEEQKTLNVLSVWACWRQKGETYQFIIYYLLFIIYLFTKSTRRQCEPFRMNQESVSAYD